MRVPILICRTIDCLNTEVSVCAGDDGRTVNLWASRGTIRSPGYDENTYPNDAYSQMLILTHGDNVNMIR